MNIFIAGSINIKDLSDNIKLRLLNIINNNEATVLVGDASGVDKNIQNFFLEHKYKKVKVYTSMKRARNNIGKWKTICVDPKGKKGREKHTVKDVKMVEHADYGFMIWDGKSQGTLNNIINLIHKKIKVTTYLNNREYIILSKIDLAKFIESLDEKSQKLYIKLISTNDNSIKKAKSNKNLQLIKTKKF